MSNSFRRFEVLLPLKFNDGQPVPDELVGETLVELRQKFRALSCETQTIHGIWEYEGRGYRDQSMRLFVDVEDSLEHRRFFEEYKERLKARFKQLDLWITSYPVDVL